jgi:mono/diheme cytochrome c family protein
VRVLKAGVVYFAIVFGAGFLPGPGRILWVFRGVGARTAEALEASIMLATTFVVACAICFLGSPTSVRATRSVCYVRFKMRILAKFAGTLRPPIRKLLMTTVSFLLFLIVGTQLIGMAQDIKKAQTSKPASKANLIVRGKYIVEAVAACSDCHTPRGENGESDRSKWLAGAPLFFQPAKPVPGWPVMAPRLAGSPPGSDAEIITLLTTGLWKDGKPLRLPMPRFRMTRSDAEAVSAYLRSLDSGGQTGNK